MQSDKYRFRLLWHGQRAAIAKAFASINFGDYDTPYGSSLRLRPKKWSLWIEPPFTLSGGDPYDNVRLGVKLGPA